MNFIKTAIISLATALISMAAAPGVSAQYRLPDSHNNRHENLLANQRPVGDKFRLDANKALRNTVLEREEAQLDEIYSINWDNPSVNPYTGMVIPDTKDLDVTGYFPPVKGHVTSNYGYRPRFGRVHKGIDLKLNVGDTVCSAFDGVVRLTRFERKGYGYYVVIRHDNGMETIYGHLSKFLVKPNQRVRAGEAIALGGNTGRSTGAHLHFETRFMGVAINPALIIDFEKGVTFSDTFAFDRKIHEPKKVTKKRRTTASKKRTSKRRTTSK